MVRYCSCYRGIGFSNRTSLVRNFAGLEICSHCGGVVPPKKSYNYDPYTELDEFGHEKKQESPYEKYCKKARIYSLNGDHVKAIGFYKDALKSTSKIKEKFDVLSAIQMNMNPQETTIVQRSHGRDAVNLKGRTGYGRKRPIS